MLKIYIILLLLISPKIFSQINIDSLWNVHKTSEKKIKFEIINKLANHYLAVSKFDSALTLTNRLLEYAEENNIDSLKAKSYSNLLFIYTEKDQHDIALDYSNKALGYAQKIDHKVLLSTIYGNTAIIFGKEGKFQQEVEYTKKSLQIAEELDSKLDMAISYGNLATAYYAQGYHKTAINYTLKSMEISKKIKDSIGIGFMSMQMGDNYTAIQKYDDALSYYDKAIKIFSKENAPLEKANAEVSYGIILTEKKDYSKAYLVLIDALKIYEELNLSNGKAYVNKSLAELYLKQNDYSEANKEALTSFEYYKNTDLKPDLIKIYLLLAEIRLKLGKLKNSKHALDNAEFLLKDIKTLSLWENFYNQKSNYYEKTGNYRLSHKNQKLLTEIKDSIQNNKNIALTTDLQIKYDVEAKRKENELLLAQNKVQQLKAEESTTIRNFSTLIILILIVMGIILYNRYLAKIQLNNKLKEVNATKDKFFSIISHDLKNPFSTLLGYTDMLIMEYKNFSEEEKKNYIGSIQKSAKHTYNLLENLLNWSRTQRGEIKITKTELYVDELVGKAVKILSETAKNKKIKLIENIPSNLKITADEETISTVIRNVITNALKFTPENGTVKVSAYDKENSVDIIIEDNGIGIDKENLDKIFRIDSHHTTEGTAHEKGTGLGLILCKEFMKNNGGDIFVESKVGTGSKFTITLPK